ncbi:MAG: hypothetical protein IKU23_06185 [Clostridia bacterium]|nr:hypothetical protein [Clostridia bacterium]
MKKLLAIIMAALMLLPLCISVSASKLDNTKSFTVYTGDSTKNYNPERQISVTISLRDINFGLNDGVSAIEFDLYYEKSKVDPVTKAANDSDNDAFDFTKLISVNPASWEGVGTLDTSAAKYTLAFSDLVSGAGTFVDNDSLVIKIPFLVKKSCRVNNIKFQIKNFRAYNSDMQTYCDAEVEDIVVRYAVQPAVNAPVPSDTIPLHVAGYRNDVNNVIFYAASKDYTVGEYVKAFCDDQFNQSAMKNYAILIAGLDGIIDYVDVKNTDKSKVKIPKGSFLIGVHRLNSDDYSDFKATVELGMQVSIYNINIESAGRTNEINDLVRAAFAVYEPGEEPVFIGGNNPEESPEPEPDLNPDPDKGTVGDVNMNGKIDARDYLLLKRAYFGTYTLQCQMSVADINGNGKIDARDYLLLKRAYFGTYTI